MTIEGTDGAAPVRGRRTLLPVLAAAAAVAAVAAALWLLAGRGATGGGRVEPPPGARDCGTVVLGQLERTPPAAAACLVAAARTGTPAVLVVSVPSVEGDPITTSYTVTGPDGVQVVTDASKDRFAGDGPKVFTQLCRGVSAGEVLLRFTSCDPQAVP